MNAQVRLLGRVDNVYDVLMRCHGLVLLSDHEGLPISMLEAMATGVVPICLDMRSGVREAIEHGVNGLIVKDREADFLAAVRGLQSDPAKWQQLSLAARETARKRYAIEESARQWLDLLEHLNRWEATRADFQAPRVLRLPPLANSYIGIRPPWKRMLETNLRYIPPLYRMAKTTVAIARTIKSQVDRLI
jgi:colanic acid/amylovoran biosynthesis glycosyltransferase